MSRGSNRLVVFASLLLAVTAVLTASVGYADSGSAPEITTNPQIPSVYFTFRKSQRKIHSEATSTPSKNRFEVKVATAQNQSPRVASAHLRGQSSFLRCSRKSYTLNFIDRAPPDFLRGSQANGYYLLSMCLDAFYIRTPTLLPLWQSLGLFPLNFQLVTLFIEGENRGLYMLVEKPADILPRTQPQVTAVIRRGFVPPSEDIEIKFTTTNQTIARGDYVNAFIDLHQFSGEKLRRRLRKYLDLDLYIRHLAVASIFENGDYIDELWFYQLTNAEDQTYSYRPFKWDPEDILGACHLGGAYAYSDRWGLAHCVESELGKIILEDPVLYRQFISELEMIMQHTLTTERITSAFASTVSQLDTAFSNPQTLVAMARMQRNQPSQLHRKTALDLIRVEANRLIKAFGSRAATIRQQLDQYHSANEN